MPVLRPCLVGLKTATFCASLAAWVGVSGAAQAQTLFAASESENALYAINPTTGAAGVVSGVSGLLSMPEGLAYYAPTGDLFIANGGAVSVGTPSGSIVQYNIRTGATSVFYAGNSGLDSPQGLTFDASGNLYATGYNSGTLVQFARTGGTLSTTATTFATDLNLPYYLASDASGGVFVANAGDGNIRRYSAANTFTTFTANGVQGAPLGLAFRGTTLFSSDAVNNNIAGFNNASGSTGTRTSPDFTITPTGAAALNGPQSLAFNATGTALYIANLGNNNIVRYNTSTGVSDVLYTGGATFTPSGLVFTADTPEPSAGLLALGGLTSAGSVSVLARRTKKRRAGVKKTA